MVVRREYANPAGIIRHKGHQVKVALAIKIVETAVPGQKRIPALRRHTLLIIIGPIPPGINMAVILAEVLLPHDDDPGLIPVDQRNRGDSSGKGPRASAASP